MACVILSNFIIDERVMDENDDAALLEDYERDLRHQTGHFAGSDFGFESEMDEEDNMIINNEAKDRLQKQLNDFMRINNLRDE
jgi:hypothetical protein